MSRIGKQPIKIPAGVKISQKGNVFLFEGPKGKLSQAVPVGVIAKLDGDHINVTRDDKVEGAAALHGLVRTLIANCVHGVATGYTKGLEINGVGYRANAQGRNLKLQLGYSHDVDVAIPEGVEVKTPDQTTVEISGMDAQKVGQLAAEIRRWRKPEPYKGKGIKYRGEFIFRKEGKKK